MHDDALERRLGKALHDEAASLPFTITPAELERRMVLRRRGLAGRRLTLLLAAAVGISLFGVGGALSGLFDQKEPTPTNLLAEPSLAAPRAHLGDTLPSLDDLVAADPGSIIVAQAHGPADGSRRPDERNLTVPPPAASLGTFASGHEYRVSYACLGNASLTLDISVPLNRGPHTGPASPCDGTMHDETFNRPQPQSVGFSLSGPASWRIVVRGDHAHSLAPDIAPIPPTAEGRDELVRWLQPVDAGALRLRNTGLIAQHVGSLPSRETFTVDALCTATDRGDSPIRVIFGSVSDGVLDPATETLIACDATTLHGTSESFADPNGGDVFLAAVPDQQVALLITGEAPPIKLTRELPGWQVSGGIGPDLSFATTPTGFSGAGQKAGGPVMVVMNCTGTSPIEVTVELGSPVGAKTKSFVADCSPEGGSTGQSFVADSYLSVDYVHPAGSWVAMSILVPDPAND